jgi:hypothetical protein
MPTAEGAEPELPAEDEDEETPDDLMLRDPEAPEADVLEQSREVLPGEHRGRVSRAIDAPDADAIEQATEVPTEPDDEPG